MAEDYTADARTETRDHVRSDHGGELAEARAIAGGAHEGGWLDLSTGINPVPYVIGAVSAAAWARLPDRAAFEAFENAARAAYHVHDRNHVVAVAGASAAIQAVPTLRAPGRVAIVGPTYNEHAAAFETAGWRPAAVAEPEDAADMDALVVVTPNNPDGRVFDAARLLDAFGRLLDRAATLLVVDESFIDLAPETTCAMRPLAEGALVLRSFGKFYGLAGLRLGAAIAAPETAADLRRAIGPWPVCGPALEIGARALTDQAWAAATRERLFADAARLDALTAAAGWRLVGGTALFRTYDTSDAAEMRARLARRGVWTRAFPYSKTWLRLGLPADADGWARLEAALAA